MSVSQSVRPSVCPSFTLYNLFDCSNLGSVRVNTYSGYQQTTNSDVITIRARDLLSEFLMAFLTCV